MSFDQKKRIKYSNISLYIYFLGERRRTKKGKAKRPSKKSIFEIYEPSELKRSHFTDLDNEVCIITTAA